MPLNPNVTNFYHDSCFSPKFMAYNCIASVCTVVVAIVVYMHTKHKRQKKLTTYTRKINNNFQSIAILTVKIRLLHHTMRIYILKQSLIININVIAHKKFCLKFYRI